MVACSAAARSVATHCQIRQPKKLSGGVVRQGSRLRQLATPDFEPWPCPRMLGRARHNFPVVVNTQTRGRMGVDVLIVRWQHVSLFPILMSLGYHSLGTSEINSQKHEFER